MHGRRHPHGSTGATDAVVDFYQIACNARQPETSHRMGRPSQLKELHHKHVCEWQGWFRAP